MHQLNIQKHILKFEQHLYQEQWENSYLLFLTPLGIMVTFFPVILLGFLLSKIFGIHVFSLVSSLTLSFAISFLFLVYRGGKEIYPIQKNLMTKSYLPIFATIEKVYKESQNNDSNIHYFYYAQLTTTFLCTGMRPDLIPEQDEITIHIKKDTYQELKQEETLFILVGKHSNYWLCTDTRFKNEGLGSDFFLNSSFFL